MTLSWLDVTLRLVLAVILGGIIGLEREIQRKPAGLRTIILVSLSSALFVLAAQGAAIQLGEPVEPGRLSSAIAQGVGFLGAGLILQSRGQVRGLTTAATLWAAAAIGAALGLGALYLAALGAALVFIVLRLLTVVEDRVLGTHDKRRPKPPRNDQEPSS
ncbi:MAG: MgtC/SapB family protein [Chloroflexi bacterium]|nr:MgtC/SapB family protein [Chloroflexota bacterium]